MATQNRVAMPHGKRRPPETPCAGRRKALVDGPQGEYNQGGWP